MMIQLALCIAGLAQVPVAGAVVARHGKVGHMDVEEDSGPIRWWC